jgi:hypothetical protein
MAQELTPGCRELIQKLMVAQLVKKLSQTVQSVFCVIITSSLVDGQRRLRQTCRLHLQNRMQNVRQNEGHTQNTTVTN